MATKRIILLFLLFPLYSFSDEQIVLEQKVKDCTLRTEVDYKWQVLTVRASHPDQKHCDIGKTDLVDIIKNTLDSLKKENNLDTIRSIFIGRLVDYPWLSDYLEKQSINNDNWDLTKGRPRSGIVNHYVGSLLLKAEVIEEINLILAKYHLKINTVSPEKVLITKIAGGPKEIKGKVPYDAMVWFVLGAI